MTQDEIIEMARQAGFIGNVHIATKELEAFAKLVAAKEREICLKIAESMSLTSANMNKTWRTGCRDVAEAIKARGEA